MYNSLLFVCQDYIFVATDMSLTLDVHDKTSGTRLRKWDIDAAIYDVIIVASKSPVTHGKHQPTHILYMHFYHVYHHCQEHQPKKWLCSCDAIVRHLVFSR